MSLTVQDIVYSFICCLIYFWGHIDENVREEIWSKTIDFQPLEERFEVSRFLQIVQVDTIRLNLLNVV